FKGGLAGICQAHAVLANDIDVSHEVSLFQFPLKAITALLRLAVLQDCLRLCALFSLPMETGTMNLFSKPCGARLLAARPAV
ncbi:MAG: hypothetical protein Q7J66_09725, partial [Hydrogenophaga sp.]|nr:hypothetical protein [Hydrogenophaga sp.]